MTTEEKKEIETLELRIRGLEVNKGFKLLRHKQSRPHIVAQAVREETPLTAPQQHRVAQVIQGNAQIKDRALVELCERALQSAQPAPQEEAITDEAQAQ
jgi:hypothetical protein